MKLHTTATSPYSRKARLVLEYKDLAYTLLETAPRDLDAKEAPLSKVPVLTTDKGEALYDSRVICQYLEALCSDPAIMPATLAERMQALKIEALADGLSDAAVAIMLEKRRDTERQETTFLAKQEKKITNALAWLENAIANRTYFIGDTLTLADFATVSALGYLTLRQGSWWREHHPNLATYHDALHQEHAIVASTVPVES